jgi:glycosyltransferase involved in cell wall biosynthesis
MGVVVHEEAKRLTALGEDVTVFTLDHGISYEQDETLPYTVVRLKTWLKVGDAGLVPQLAWRLRGFDIVHVHYPWYGALEWVLIARIMFRVPYVVTYHMDAAPTGLLKHFIQVVYDTVWARLFLSMAERVIAVDAQHIRSSRFGKRLSEERLEVISNAVDTTVFHPEAGAPVPSALDGFQHKKIFLFVGNPLPFKRLDWVIKALARLPENMVLAVVSGGYSINEYRALALELGLQDRVRFVGRLPSQIALNQYYQSAHCLVVASVGAAESFALVAAEALSAGCPVIASNIPGVRSRVRDSQDGFLFESTSLDMLVAVMKRMGEMSPEERNAFGLAGRERVVEECSWDTHMSALMRVYKVL